MRPILLVTLAVPALAAALPAQAQRREDAACVRDFERMAQLDVITSAEAQRSGAEEAAVRDRYVALNREITELNTSGRNPARLMQLRNERAGVVAQLNGMNARRAQPTIAYQELEAVRARYIANKCRVRTPRAWDRQPVPTARPAEQPWRPGDPFPTTMPSTAAMPSMPARPGAAPSSYAAWMTGAFSTAWGRTTLSPGGGTYEFEGGSIEVESISGPVMEGKWRQTGSGGCPDKGHWGKFKFTFTANGFTGNFGHCGGPLNQGSWNGSRIR